MQNTVNKKVTVSYAYNMMNLLHHLANQTSGNPKGYAKPIAKTMRNIDKGLKKVTEGVKERHITSEKDDRFFLLSAQLETLNTDRLTEAQVKQVDDMKEEKDALLKEDETLQERYEAYTEEMEKTSKEEISIEIWLISENALPKEMSPQIMSDMYEYELLNEGE